MLKYRNEIEFLGKDAKKLSKKQRQMILQVDKADKRLPIQAKMRIRAIARELHDEVGQALTGLKLNTRE